MRPSTDVVSPNADTLYSSGWLDVSTEPQVLSLPDFGTRVLAGPHPSTRGATCSRFRDLGQSGGPGDRTWWPGPNWKGNVPKGLTLLRSPTAMNWIVARYATSGGNRPGRSAQPAGPDATHSSVGVDG